MPNLSAEGTPPRLLPFLTDSYCTGFTLNSQKRAAQVSAVICVWLSEKIPSHLWPFRQPASSVGIFKASATCPSLHLPLHPFQPPFPPCLTPCSGPAVVHRGSTEATATPSMPLDWLSGIYPHSPTKCFMWRRVMNNPSQWHILGPDVCTAFNPRKKFLWKADLSTKWLLRQGKVERQLLQLGKWLFLSDFDYEPLKQRFCCHPSKKTTGGTNNLELWQ